MPWTAQERSSHLQFHIHVSSILVCSCFGKPLEVMPSFPFSSGADRSLTTGLFLVGGHDTLFSGLGIVVHFSGDESGMQWEAYLFELQNVVERRMVMSRGPDKRAQMHAMSVLLSTCESMSDRVSLTKEQTGYCSGASKNSETRQLV